MKYTKAQQRDLFFFNCFFYFLLTIWFKKDKEQKEVINTWTGWSKKKERVHEEEYKRQSTKF